MNLKNLVKWTETARNVNAIREKVRKDLKGFPRESDVTISLKMLDEIKKRALLIDDHLKKADRYQKDIAEYLFILEERGIVYSPEGSAAGTDIYDNPQVKHSGSNPSLGSANRVVPAPSTKYK